jgi:polar amino acid transport system substrate-binding protein
MAGLLVVALLLSWCQSVRSEQVSFSSLEWPPYTSSVLPGRGATGSIVQQILKAADINFQFLFFPWNRAVRSASAGATVGYFPEYYSFEVNREFLYSDQIGESPLGFALPAGKTVEWESLRDLKGLRIGVVDGYLNTEEFDTLAESGVLTVDAGMDDLTNLRKLALGRLDLVVIDRNVFDFLMKTETVLTSEKGKLVFADKLLAQRGLYICLARRDGAVELLEKINKAIGTMDWRSIQFGYLSRVLD